MHRELVERRGWIAEAAFLRGFNFANFLPGPEAQQLATYVGWRLHGIPGGVLAGAMFVLPSVFVLLALSYIATAHGEAPYVAAMLYGVQPVVVAIVVEAIGRIGRRTLRHPAHLAIAGASFLAATLARVPFPVIVAVAAIAGIALARIAPSSDQAPEPGPEATAGAREDRRVRSRAIAARAFRAFAIFAAMWAVPVAALAALRGPSDIVVQEALFFTQAAFVTFGGAYAVLSYVAQETVGRGWVTAEQMIQGLALAESTPGPLIMVLQHVGFVAAWNAAVPERRLADAVLGALVTTYVTFLPSFFFIFAGAPYIEAIGRVARARAALTGITAAVVGAILSLAVLFASNVLLPGGRADLFALVLAMATYAGLRAGLPVVGVVPAGALAGLAWRLALG